MAAKTPKEREEERRAKKLQEVKDQVASGSLTIRQMTDEERAKYAPRERDPNDPPRRGKRS